MSFYYVSDTKPSFEEAKFNETIFCHRWVYSPISVLTMLKGSYWSISRVLWSHRAEWKFFGGVGNEKTFWKWPFGWNMRVKFTMQKTEEEEFLDKVGNHEQRQVWEFTDYSRGKLETWNVQPEWGWRVKQNLNHGDCYLLCEKVQK